MSIEYDGESIDKPIERVLVVDDNPATLTAVCWPLRGAGYEVFEADNAEKALEYVYSHHPHVVLTEIRLPGMGGLELARMIRSDVDLSDILVVHLSADMAPSKAQRASHKSGADAYIARPIPSSELLARLSSLYRQKRMMDVLHERERQLREAYELLTFHVNNSPLAVIEWDHAFRVSRWSGRAEAMFGWRESEVLGLHPCEWPFIHPDDMAHVDRIMLALLKGTTPHNVGMGRNLTRQGRIVHTEWYNSVHLNEAGSLKSILSLVHDVTERVRAREALQENERLLKIAGHTARLGGWSIDLAAMRIHWSDVVSALLELPPGKTLTFDASLALHTPESRAVVLKALKACALKGESFDVEVPMLTATGRTIHVRGTGQPRRNAKGEITHIEGAFQDITDRRQAEETLRASEARFRELLELLPVSIYVCDSTGSILQFNQAAAQLWGREPKTGKQGERYCGSWKIYRPDGRRLPHAQCAMAETLLTGKPVRNREIVIRRPDGSRVTSVVNTAPLLNERGELVGAVNCLLNMTDRKRVEEACRYREARLRVVLDSIAEGVIRVGEKGVIESVGPEVGTILGYPGTELLGRNLRSLIPDKPREQGSA